MRNALLGGFCFYVNISIFIQIYMACLFYTWPHDKVVTLGNYNVCIFQNA